MFIIIKEKILNNKIIKAIFFALMIPILTLGIKYLLLGGTIFGTFIRKLIELTSC